MTDPIIEAARELPAISNADRSDYLRSLIGTDVIVRSAPDSHRWSIGLVARVSDVGDEYGVAALDNLDDPRFPILLDGVARGWAFEAKEVAPLRRSREVYDHEAFKADLDAAIDYVRSVVKEERSSVPANPHLTPGISMRESMARVCDALVLRQAMGLLYSKSLDAVLQSARAMLIAKNAAYGDSALNPVRVFSTASLKEQLLVRLDDKASRLARGQAAGEDVAADMLGYLLLVVIAEKREREQA